MLFTIAEVTASGSLSWSGPAAQHHKAQTHITQHHYVCVCPDPCLQKEVLKGIRQLCYGVKSQGLPEHLSQRHLGVQFNLGESC